MKNKGRVSFFKKSMFTIDLETNIFEFEKYEEFGLKKYTTIRTFLEILNKNSYFPKNKIAMTFDPNFIDIEYVTKYINNHSNGINILSNSMVFYQIKATILEGKIIQGEIFFLRYSALKLDKSSHNLFHVKEHSSFGKYDEKMKNISKGIEKGSFIFFDLIDNYFFDKFGFILYNFLYFQLSLDNTIKYTSLTEDMRLIFIFDEQIDLLSVIQELKFFVKKSFDFEFVDRCFSNHFSHFEFYKTFQLSLLEYINQSNSGILPSKHKINKMYNDFLMQVKPLNEDIKNLEFVKNEIKDDERNILEYHINLKNELLFLIFWLDPFLANKILFELLQEANKEQSKNKKLTLIVVTVPFWFLAFLNKNLFIDEHILINFKLTNLESFKNRNIKVFFNPQKISFLSQSINLSLEYIKDVKLSRDFNEFNFNYIIFRKTYIPLKDLDWAISQDIQNLETKTKELNKRILLI